MWVTSAKEASQKADAMAAFSRAMAKTNAYAESHIAEEQAAAAKILHVDLKTVQGGAKPNFPTTVDQSSIQRTVDQMRELGYLKSSVDVAGLVLAAK